MVDEDKNVAEMVDDLSKFITKGEKDARKFDNGNVSAAIRLRKHLQKARAKCKDIRVHIQFVRKIRRRIQDETGTRRKRPDKTRKVRGNSSSKIKRRSKEDISV